MTLWAHRTRQHDMSLRSKQPNEKTKLTTEIEKDKILTFLDVLVAKNKMNTLGHEDHRKLLT